MSTPASYTNYVENGIRVRSEISIHVRTWGLGLRHAGSVQEFSKTVAFAVQSCRLAVRILLRFATGERTPVLFDFEVAAAQAEGKRLLFAAAEIQNAGFL